MGRIQWMGENVVIVYFLNLDYAEEDEFKGPHSQKVGHFFLSPERATTYQPRATPRATPWVKSKKILKP